MGAPNVEEFTPGSNSLIKVSDFANPRQLADYLLKISQSPEEYNLYHKWRQYGLGKFAQMLHYTYHTLPCRVCQKIAEMKHSK